MTNVDLTHLSTPGDFSIGVQTGIAENFRATMERQIQLDSMLGFRVALDEQYKKMLERLGGVTGEEFQLPQYDVPAYDSAVNEYFFDEPLSAEGFLPESFAQLEEMSEFIRSTDERVLALKQQYPDLQTFNEIIEGVLTDRAELREELDEVMRRGGPGTFLLGQLPGGIVGSLNPETDPFLVLSMFFGGWGRTIGMRMLTEAIVGGGVEAAQQGLFIRPERKLLGEPQEPFIASVLFAALGTGALRGVLEGGARGVGALARRETRAERVEADAAIERIVSTARETDLPDAEIANILKQLPRTTENDLVIRTLEADARSGSPYPNTRSGRVAETIEVADAAREFEGLPRQEVDIRQLQEAVSARVEARLQEGVEPTGEFFNLRQAEQRITELETRLREVEGTELDASVRASLRQERQALRRAQSSAAEAELRQGFHGTSEPNLAVRADHFSTKNYYGQGFYTTDTFDISEGYAINRARQASGEGYIYSVAERRSVKLLDMEKPISSAVAKTLRATKDDVVLDALDTEPKNLRELYDEIRIIAEDTVEAQETFEIIAEGLRELGFKGLKHEGGLLTGKPSHEVRIYFDPEGDLDVTRLDTPVRQRAQEVEQLVESANDPSTGRMADSEMDAAVDRILGRTMPTDKELGVETDPSLLREVDVGLDEPIRADLEIPFMDGDEVKSGTIKEALEEIQQEEALRLAARTCGIGVET